MTWQGIQISQEGRPIDRAPDYQKTLDSRWRFLEIAYEFEYEFTRAESGGDHLWVQKILDHDLGFHPAFTHRWISDTSSHRSQGNRNVIATKDAIYIQDLFLSGDSTAAFTRKGYLRVFACGILLPYQAPLEFIVPGKSSVGVPRMSVRTLKDGRKNINSHDMADFSQDSGRAKSLAIQLTGAYDRNPLDGLVTVTHNIGYPPTYFMSPYVTAADYATISAFPSPLVGEDWVYPMDAGPFSLTQATNTQLVINAGAIFTKRLGILITKEPAELAV